MPLYTYAYLIKRDAALLNAVEWEPIKQLLSRRIRKVQKYREITGASLEEARQHEAEGQQALNLYAELTSIELEHPEQLYGIEQARYGSLCPKCEKPFRTPRAKLCASCGFQLPKGTVAGVLGETKNAP